VRHDPPDPPALRAHHVGQQVPSEGTVPLRDVALQVVHEPHLIARAGLAETPDRVVAEVTHARDPRQASDPPHPDHVPHRRRRDAVGPADHRRQQPPVAAPQRMLVPLAQQRRQQHHLEDARRRRGTPGSAPADRSPQTRPPPPAPARSASLHRYPDASAVSPLTTTVALLPTTRAGRVGPSQGVRAAERQCSARRGADRAAWRRSYASCSREADGAAWRRS